MEFFAAGTPVAAFPTGALPEVIAHGESGLLAPDHSAPALAGLLGALLGDGVLRERLGRGAAAAAAGRFAPRRFLTQTLAVYEAALARRRGSVAQG
jgi:glycosyltransferase involved in cell wall biosynthesis